MNDLAVLAPIAALLVGLLLGYWMAMAAVARSERAMAERPTITNQYRDSLSEIKNAFTSSAAEHTKQTIARIEVLNRRLDEKENDLSRWRQLAEAQSLQLHQLTNPATNPAPVTGNGRTARRRSRPDDPNDRMANEQPIPFDNVEGELGDIRG